MKRLTLLVPLLALTGCATTQDVVDHKNRGTARTYAVTKDQVYDAAVRILRNNPGSPTR